MRPAPKITIIGKNQQYKVKEILSDSPSSRVYLSECSKALKKIQKPEDENLSIMLEADISILT